MINVALDTEILLALSKWHDQKFDEDGIIHSIAKFNGSIYPSYVKRMIMQNGLKNPKIFDDSWLNTLIKVEREGEEPNRIYPNLNNIIWLYNMIKSGEIKAYRLPTVAHEFDKCDIDRSFVYEYIPVLQVEIEDRPKFSFERNYIAQQYVEAGAIDKTKLPASSSDYVPRRARKIAEASRVGLYLMVKREDFYIHNAPGDYLRRTTIQDINRECNLYFEHNTGAMLPTSPISFTSFIKCLKRDHKDACQKAFYGKRPSIENNTYIPDGKMDNLTEIRAMYRPIVEDGEDMYPSVSPNIEDEYLPRHKS